MSSISYSSQHKPPDARFQAPPGTSKHMLFLFQVTYRFMWLTEEQAWSQVGNELTLCSTGQ